MLKKMKTKALLPASFVIAFLISLFLLSSTNTKFDQIEFQTFKMVEIDKYLSNEKNPSKSLMVSSEIKKILPYLTEAPNKAISIFLDFKNRYTDKYGSNDNGGKLLNNVFNHIDRKPSPYLPTNTFVNAKIWDSFFFFISQLITGFLAYYFVKNRVFVRRFIVFLVTSATLLGITGAFQKINYVPSDNLKEIFGIWDTPEPRYFYASFTYKNHWSAYAILMLSCLLALCVREIRKQSLFRNENITIFLYLLGIFVLIVSIPHSGSRSGLVILICLFILLLFIIFKTKIIHLKTQYLITIFFLLCFSSIGGLLLSKNTTNEMLTNSISQIKNEKPPLRILLWKDLINQISQKTFWGYGYNSYGTLNPLFQSKVVRDERAKGLANAHTPYIPLIGYGHSDILEWISEFGWVGVVVLILPTTLLICRNLFFSKSIFVQIISIGTLCFLLYCCVDFPTRSPACLISFSIIIGLSTRYSNLSFKKNFH
jgi:O-antigen ligase